MLSPVQEISSRTFCRHETVFQLGDASQSTHFKSLVPGTGYHERISSMTSSAASTADAVYEEVWNLSKI